MRKSLPVLNKTHTFVPSDVLNKHADEVKKQLINLEKNDMATNENIVIIEAERDGYSLEQVRSTMTVKELIEVLSEYDEDAKVYLSHDYGYTYGGIRYGSFLRQEIE